ncbi:MAG: hypothetical protein HY926_05725 [Elusimicrobia bacterium]|nr:hypothetical protein [Elusimicrobiota bacterium]
MSYHSCRLAWRSELALFCLLFLAAAYFQHPEEYDNSASRFYLLSAMVDEGRLDIGSFAGQTVDVAPYAGKTFSNKAIGTPLLAAPAYAFLRKATGLGRGGPLSLEARYVTRVWAVGIPFALQGVVLYRLLLLFGALPGAAFLAALAYGLGTVAWLHATLFSGHQTAASFTFFAFAWLAALTRRPGAGVWGWLGAGLCAGLGALADYLAGWCALVLAVYALGRASRWSQRQAFLGGLAVCAGVLAAYNAACFGSPFTLAYVHMGRHFAAGTGQGIFGVGWPRADALLGVLASPARGVFFIMPVLLSCLPGFVAMLGRPRLRAEGWVCLAVAGGLVLVNAGYFSWQGGWTFGPRYVVCALPFLVLPAAFAFDRLWFFPLFLLSAGQIFSAVAVTPNVPEYVRNPLVETMRPLWGYGAGALNLGLGLGFVGVWAALPLWAAVGALAWWGWPGGKWEVGRRAWRWVYGLGFAAVVLSLASLRSPSAGKVHACNAKLLRDMHAQVPGDALNEAAAREARLAQEDGEGRFLSEGAR